MCIKSRTRGWIYLTQTTFTLRSVWFNSSEALIAAGEYGMAWIGRLAVIADCDGGRSSEWEDGSNVLRRMGAKIRLEVARKSRGLTAYEA